MTRTSARAKKPKQDVMKRKEEAQKPEETKTDSESSGELTDKENNTGSTNYDVEKITHTRLYKGKRQYLVRWKGYSEDCDTWENESTLQSCKEILDSFKKEHLAEANSDDDLTEEVTVVKGKTDKKKEVKTGKKNVRKSDKLSQHKADDQDSKTYTDEEPEENTLKGKKRKSETQTKSSKAKKEKKVERTGESEEKDDEENVADENSEDNSTEEETEIKGKAKQKKVVKTGKKSAKKSGTAPKQKESSKEKKAGSDDESVTDGKDYEVEKILEVHTRRDGSHEFLIRWKGYKPSDDTWEPEAHLDCKELIDKFMEKVDKAKELSRKEFRQRTETKRFVPQNPRRNNQRNSGLRPCYRESQYED